MPPRTTPRPGSTEPFAVHGQFTYIEQESSAFTDPYSGPNSLRPSEGAETTDATLYLGTRLWSGAEAWINPELDQGFGLDDTVGVAGFPSGEAYKVGKSKPYLRLQRAFIRDTINVDGPLETVASDLNVLGAARAANRWVFSVGKFAVGDVFDVNQYAHDPRADFLNWAAVDAGTFDYAADAWGYTVGGAIERYQGSWALRLGVFDLSTVPNSEHLEPGFAEYQGVAELEKRYVIAQRRGKLMITVFDSRGRMGLLDQAVQVAELRDTAVDIAAVRRYRTRLGIDLNLEQQLTDGLGAFARWARRRAMSKHTNSPISIERFDRAVAKGSGWHRAGDTVGWPVSSITSRPRVRTIWTPVAWGSHRRRPTTASGSGANLETYYQAVVLSFAQVTLDYQWISHPAYNLDRGRYPSLRSASISSVECPAVPGASQIPAALLGHPQHDNGHGRPEDEPPRRPNGEPVGCGRQTSKEGATGKRVSGVVRADGIEPPTFAV